MIPGEFATILQIEIRLPNLDVASCHVDLERRSFVFCAFVS